VLKVSLPEPKAGGGDDWIDIMLLADQAPFPLATDDGSSRGTCSVDKSGVATQIVELSKAVTAYIDQQTVWLKKSHQPTKESKGRSDRSGGGPPPPPKRASGSSGGSGSHSGGNGGRVIKRRKSVSSEADTRR